VFANLAEGVRYVRTTPILLISVTVVGLVATFGMNMSVLVPPLADHVLGVGATGYGFLMAASGIGSTVSALSVAFAPRVSPRRMIVGACALGVGLIILAWSRSFPLSLFAMMIAGAGGIGMAVTANTTLQLNVPDVLRGRVMSVYTTVFSGSVPAGGLIMGAIASSQGVPVALGIGAALSLAVGLLAWRWLRRIEATTPATATRRPVPAGVTAAARSAAGATATDADARSSGSVTSTARPR
jgi:MFS family permease